MGLRPCLRHRAVWGEPTPRESSRTLWWSLHLLGTTVCWGPGQAFSGKVLYDLQNSWGPDLPLYRGAHSYLQGPDSSPAAAVSQRPSPATRLALQPPEKADMKSSEDLSRAEARASPWSPPLGITGSQGNF